MGLTIRNNYRMLLYVNTLVIVLLSAGFAVGAIFLLFPVNLGQGYHSALATVQAIRKVLFWKVALIYGVIFFLMVLAIGVLHLFYSHLIAGPTHRIGDEAAKIAQGNLTCNIKLRRKDSLTDIKDLLNDAAYRYRARLTAIRDCLGVIEMQSDTVADLIRRGGEGVALKQAAQEITNNVKSIERSLSEFRI